MSTDAGKRYVGHALELRHRLPRVWRRVQSGGLRPWLARRIAEKTLLLSPWTPLSFVDRHVAPTAHRIGPVQLDRLVDEAIGRSCPTAERRAPGDGGRPVLHGRVPAAHAYDGTLAVHGELDIADAMELETAIQTVAAQLKDLGSEESLDVRRSMAVGELARRELALDLFDRWLRRAPRARLETTPPPEGRALRPPLRRRPHRHTGVARVERGNHLVTTGQAQDWCNVADQLVVQPVRDPRPPPADAHPTCRSRRRDRRHPPGTDDTTSPP